MNKTIFYGENKPDDDDSNVNQLLIKGDNSTKDPNSEYLLGNLASQTCSDTKSLFSPVTNLIF